MNTGEFNLKKYSRMVFLIGMFIMLMLNWNEYSLFTKVERYNPVMFALLIVIMGIAHINIKEIRKDYVLFVVVIINVIAAGLLLKLKSSFYTEIILFDITMVLYLVDKVKFTKGEILAEAAVIAAFFIYWTVDVKGYFKGYSINLGGEILVSGFMFLIFIVEYLRIQLPKWKKIPVQIGEYIKEHIFVFTLVEAAIAFGAYKIIAYYRSRTAFVVLIVFGILLITEKIVRALGLLENKIYADVVMPATAVLSVAGMVIVPFIYVALGRKPGANFAELFFKPIYSDRFTVWPGLLGIVKQFPFTGLGTMYMQDAEGYRNGLLDTYNSAINLAVVHGLIVAVLVLGLAIYRLVQATKKIRGNHMMNVAFIILISMIVCSYSENYILTVPFMGFFFMAFGIIGSGLEKAEQDFNIREYLSENKTKFAISFAPSAALAIMYLLLGPVEIYYSNYDEFSFTNKDYLLQFILATLAFTVIVTLILLLFDGVVNKLLAALLFSLTVASYVQYMFMNKELMNIDGGLKSKSEVGSYGTVTFVIWIAVVIACLVLPVVLKKAGNSVIVYGSGLLCAVMAVAIISLPLMNIGKHKYNLMMSGEKQLSIAPNDNIIILELDTFSRELSDCMLREYPDAFDAFNDFTYYTNSDTTTYGTYKSIIHMLTGLDYDPSMKRYEWTEAAFSNEAGQTMFNELHDQGYTVNAYTKDILFEELTGTAFDNVAEVNVYPERGYLFERLLRMSIYRYVPFEFKEKFEVPLLAMDEINRYDGTITIWKNSDFNKAIVENGLSIDDSMNNGFFLNHFAGFHRPLINNENADPCNEGDVADEACFRGAIKVCENYLDALRNIGKYDDSTIIILGDHGLGTHTDGVLLIKHKGEAHDVINEDETPVTYDDFIKTILAIVGVEYDGYGEYVW